MGCCLAMMMDWRWGFHSGLKMVPHSVKSWVQKKARSLVQPMVEHSGTPRDPHWDSKKARRRDRSLENPTVQHWASLMVHDLVKPKGPHLAFQMENR